MVYIYIGLFLYVKCKELLINVNITYTRLMCNKPMYKDYVLISIIMTLHKLLCELECRKIINNIILLGLCFKMFIY